MGSKGPLIRPSGTFSPRGEGRWRLSGGNGVTGASRIDRRFAALPLSPRGRGREAMAYGCGALPIHVHSPAGAVVSHVAELVRGDLVADEQKAPSSGPSGHLLPKGRRGVGGSRIDRRFATLPLSPRGRGREAMTYGCGTLPIHMHSPAGAVVSHMAELVRGDLIVDEPKAPSSALRAPSPQGEKGLCRRVGA